MIGAIDQVYTCLPTFVCLLRMVLSSEGCLVASALTVATQSISLCIAPKRSALLPHLQFMKDLKKWFTL